MLFCLKNKDMQFRSKKIDSYPTFSNRENYLITRELSIMRDYTINIYIYRRHITVFIGIIILFLNRLFIKILKYQYIL